MAGHPDVRVLRRWCHTTYAIGAAMILLVWITMVLVIGGESDTFKLSVTALIGLLFGGAVIATNWSLCIEFEEIAGYAEERRDADEVQRNAFYITTALFSMTSIINHMNRKLAQIVTPMILLTLFFAVVMVLCPVWVSTSDPRQMILLKHMRTVCFATAMSQMVSAIAVCLLLTFRNGALQWRYAGGLPPPETPTVASKRADGSPM